MRGFDSVLGTRRGAPSELSANDHAALLGFADWPSRLRAGERVRTQVRGTKTYDNRLLLFVDGRLLALRKAFDVYADDVFIANDLGGAAEEAFEVLLDAAHATPNLSVKAVSSDALAERLDV